MWSHSASHKLLSFQSSYIRHWLGGSSQRPLSSPFSTNLWKLCCCFEPPLWLLWGGGGAVLLELQFIVRSFSHFTSFSFSACSLNFFHLLPIWTSRGMQTATISHMLKVVHENMWATVQIPLAIQCDMQLLLLLSLSVNTWSHFIIKSLHNGAFCGQSGSWKGLSPKFELDSNENKRKKMVAIVVNSD
jgi:hypothetical protein